MVAASGKRTDRRSEIASRAPGGNESQLDWRAERD
jgi:hypothetical protein